MSMIADIHEKNPRFGGRKFSTKHKARISETLKKYYEDPKERQKLSKLNLGRKHSVESRSKMSEAAKKRMQDPEIRKKLSKAQKNLWLDPEYHQKQSESMIGRTLSAKHRVKLSEVAKKRFEDPEERQRMSERMTGTKNPNFGKKRSEKIRVKISEGLTGRVLSEATRAKIKAANIGKTLSEEHKDKISASLMGKKTKEDSRSKMSEAWTTERKIKQSEDRTGSKNPNYGRTGEKHPMWKGGVSYLPYCPHFNDKIKETIRNRCNRTCTICGVSELQHVNRTGKWLGRLDVDHLDSQKMAGCYGWKWRLTALCKHCHGKMIDETQHRLLQLLLLKNKRHHTNFLFSQGVKA